MERFLRAYLNPSLTPNREQYLLISDSKHLFFSGERETIKYQKKELDHRTCGNRKILTRYAVVDVDTGVLYAEAYPRDEEIDVAGFLARAWAKKKDHPMQGAPRLLGIPAAVYKKAGMMEGIQFVSSLSDTLLSEINSGFGPGTVALREYERAITSHTHRGVSLYTLLGGANLFSFVASGSASGLFKKQWEQVVPLSNEFLDRMDAAYEESGYWRREPFDRFIVR